MVYSPVIWWGNRGELPKSTIFNSITIQKRKEIEN